MAKQAPIALTYDARIAPIPVDKIKPGDTYYCTGTQVQNLIAMNLYHAFNIGVVKIARCTYRAEARK
jgi:hypothetical protein